MSQEDCRGTDPLWSDLQGHHLIEASAGTGKTYTISGLYLRLVVEAQWRVDQILVVTFTEAATEELRDRIRGSLEKARGAIAAGSSDDPFFNRLLERLNDPGKADLLLQRALQSFDQAAIHTIHGFCRRALQDHAFESARPFQVELLPDPSELVREVFNDFWRRQRQDWDRFLAEHLENQGPDTLMRQLSPYLDKPDLQICPPEQPADCHRAAERYTQAFRGLRNLWEREEESIRRILFEALENLNRNQYSRDKLQDWLDRLQDTLRWEEAPLQWFASVPKLGAASLSGATRKNKTAPEHEFFAAMDRTLQELSTLKACLEYKRKELLEQALRYAWEEIPGRKHQRRVQSFPDLLENLDRALSHPHQGPGLLSSLRKRLPVALIDEFQDTDRTQYNILSRIYAASSSPLFLVGDPKQSIYAFRGADIFAYLRAQKELRSSGRGRMHNLPYNWRSEPGLVRACNLIFLRHPRPFWLRDIPYSPVEPAREGNQLILSEEMGPEPFQWWFLSGEDSGKPRSKKKARQELAGAAAGEVSRLLAAAARGEAGFRQEQGKWRPLRSRDIAVLARTHRELELVRSELSSRGIASVEHSQASVYHTLEAQELERALLAIADPHNQPVLKGALASSFHGYKGQGLYELTREDRDWDLLLDSFQRLNEIWRAQGFISMFRHWLQEFQVRSRLLSLPDGERSLTNLLHLGELLQRRCAEADYGPEGLLGWLASRRQAEGKGSEEEQLRLESDENLVQLVTVHKSKGLEYPVVLCPFLWDLTFAEAKETEPVEYHDPQNRYQPVLDLGSRDIEGARARHKEESLAESLRLLYVALTRASNRVYAASGRINGLESSALGYLLHACSEEGPYSAHPEELRQTLKNRSETQMRQDLESLVREAPDAFRIRDTSRDAAGEPCPAEQAAEPDQLIPRTFQGQIRRPLCVTSFSGLVHNLEGEEREWDPGETEQTEGAESAGSSSEEEDIASFPRGTRAGRCLHAAMERADFTADPGDWSAAVRQALQETGYSIPAWEDTLLSLLHNAVSTPLGGPLSATALGDIDRGHRLDELSFYFPLAELSPERLHRTLQRFRYSPGPASPEQGPSLGFTPQQGYMRGFIDLVFYAEGRYYLADYKSNRLGSSSRDYTPQALQRSMQQHGYVLQYLLYSVALHRFLSSRLAGYDYDLHFGGVFYLFLRGMHPELGPGAGVYFDRPRGELIQSLEDLFQGEG